MRRRFAKILATVGPASRDPANLALLHDAGVDAFRLNFSHGEHADHGKAVAAIRAVEARSGNAICIVADMQGPKIRCGAFTDDGKGEGIDLRWGQEIEITLGEEAGSPDTIPVPHAEVFAVSEPGHRLKLDDGKLQVTILSAGKTSMTARVDVPGRLTNRKGVNVIDAVLPVSAMTDKDARDMVYALDQDVDFIALSFVQTADDVRAARKIVGDRAGIIVKLEKPAAMTNLDAILAEADAAMVARGDLGVELPLEDVPVAQRRIIRSCRALGKPVIVATHMLESMIDAPTPTRAEASDVASAIYQGADVVMLSAETAVGRHPATAVAVMDRILTAVEADPEYWNSLATRRLAAATAEDAISRAARTTVDALNCRAVFGYTSSGKTVLRIARERPNCPIIGLTPRIETARRLALSWGVRPLTAADPGGFDAMNAEVERIAVSEIGLESGDSFVITAGVPFGKAGTTNTLKIGMVS